VENELSAVKQIPVEIPAEVVSLPIEAISAFVTDHAESQKAKIDEEAKKIAVATDLAIAKAMAPSPVKKKIVKRKTKAKALDLESSAYETDTPFDFNILQ